MDWLTEYEGDADDVCWVLIDGYNLFQSGQWPHSQTPSIYTDMQLNEWWVSDIQNMALKISQEITFLHCQIGKNNNATFEHCEH